MTLLVWVVPLDASPDQLGPTTAALRMHDVDHRAVAPDELQVRLSQEAPQAALVHGGPVSPALVDAQRWLVGAGVPTMVLAEGLTDNFESILLDRGAQDVLALPATDRRLGSRVGAMMRHLRLPADSSLPDSVSLGGRVVVWPRARSVRAGAEDVHLTKSEFDLLLTLALRHGEVVARSELTAASGSAPLTPRALETHLSRLRVKLRQVGAGDLLVPVRGIGYRLDVE